MSAVAGMNNLFPPEIQYRVLNFLPEADLLNARRVCRGWSNMVLYAKSSDCEALAAAKRTKLISANNFYSGRYRRSTARFDLPEKEVVLAQIKDEPNKIGVISLSPKYRFQGRIYNLTGNSTESMYPKDIVSSVPFGLKDDSLEKIFTFSTGAAQREVSRSDNQKKIIIKDSAGTVVNTLKMKFPIRDFLVTSQGYLTVAIDRHLYIYRLSDLQLIRDIEEDFTAICLSKDQSFLVGYNNKTSLFTTLRFDDPNASLHKWSKWQKVTWSIRTIVSTMFETLGRGNDEAELMDTICLLSLGMYLPALTIGILVITAPLNPLTVLVGFVAMTVFCASLAGLIMGTLIITAGAVVGLYLGIKKVTYLA